MSSFSELGTTWHFSSDEHEPLLELPLKDCTPNQIKAKLKFLEKNILLLRCECEVIELNSLKVQPELAATNTIDVSWMPYDFNAEVLRLPVANKMPRTSREKFRQSAVLSKSNKTVLGSIYSVFSTASAVNKISIHQMISEVERAIITMDEYFDKINNKAMENLNKIENETENIEIEINRQLQYIETFRTNVLVAGVNKFTKRIPADKFGKFIKKKLMTTSIHLNDLQFRITDAISEQQMLHERYVTSKHIRETVFETDMHNVRTMNKKLLKEQIEMSTKNQQLNRHLGIVRQDYLKKKYDLEKFELTLGLPSLDAEIKRYRNKLLKLKKPIAHKIPVVVESHNNYRNDIDYDIHDEDDDDDDDDDDDYGLSQNDTITIESIDDRIDHYLEVKRSIEKTEREIRSARLKLDRQKNLYKCMFRS